jgi:hypothetical protein
MTRRCRDQTFRKSDVVRALRAAKTAGIPNPRIEIDRHGTISILPGKPGDALTNGDDGETSEALRKLI